MTPLRGVEAAYWREQDAQSELTGSIDVESFQIEVGRRNSAVFDITLAHPQESATPAAEIEHKRKHKHKQSEFEPF